MRSRWVPCALTCAMLAFFLSATQTAGQSAASPAGTEIPIERCDRLPVLVVQVDKTARRFLIDTAATSMLNAKSFSGMQHKEVHIQSWNETTALNAADVFVDELALGGHAVRNVKLPAIDLTAISKACRGPLDGILGVDLLEKLGVTIDLERSVARLAVAAPDSAEASLIADMEKAMKACSDAFNRADVDKLAPCFDQDFALSSPDGELHGREEAMNHFRAQYFDMRPPARLSITLNEQRAVGDVVWTMYDYTIESPNMHRSGRGMMLCRRTDKHWRILSMHEAPVIAESR
jgi:ketosteroid isomerase-like protein